MLVISHSLMVNYLTQLAIFIPVPCGFHSWLRSQVRGHRAGHAPQMAAIAGLAAGAASQGRRGSRGPRQDWGEIMAGEHGWRSWGNDGEMIICYVFVGQCWP